ncbi:MAG: hypothetical protein ABJF23_11470 [Bryobacteraceae bacterium]
MKIALGFLLIIGANASAQSSEADKADRNKLHSILLALKSAKAARPVLAKQLADEMMALAVDRT